MRVTMVERREGEDCGPIDWDHPTARGMPPIWREAEKDPSGFTLDGRRIHAIRMWDGWPYWKPTPAILSEGPLGGEWLFFTSYGVHPNSIARRLR